MKKSSTPSRLKRSVAAGLGFALLAGGSLVAAAPAQASSDVQVFASDIAPDATTYTGWHQGYNGGVATVTAEGLQLENRSQIINGLETPAGFAELELAANGGASWASTPGSAPAFFQIPVNFGAGPDKGFTTLRPAEPVSGSNTASLTQNWATSRALGSFAPNAIAPLGDLLTELNNLGSVEVLAFGVLSNDATTSVVTSISWLGTNYSFHQDPLSVGTVTVTGEATVGSVLSGSSAGWPAGTELAYQWGWNGGNMGGEIPGATSSSYTVTADYVGRKLVLIVTGTLPGFSPNWARSADSATVVAPQKPAAPAPLPNSTGLAAYLASKGATPLSQSETGLPAAPIDPTKPHTANVAWNSADSFVDVYAFSSPVFVGTFPVVNGVAQITLSAKVLSQLEAGSHTLVITGQSSGNVQAVAVNVALVLAATGANALVPVSVAALLLMLGAALVVARRRSVRA